MIEITANKMGDNIMKRVYYRKLMMMYSGVYLIFTMFFFSIFFAALRQSEEEKQTQQNKVLLMEYVKVQEEKTALLISTAEKISGNNSLASYALSGGNGYYQQMLLLKNELRNLSDDTRPQLMIHKYGDDTCISSMQSTKVLLQLQKFGITQEEYDKILTSFSKSDLKNKKLVMTDNGILYIITNTFGDTRMVLSSFEDNWETLRDYGEGSIASFVFLDKEIEDLRSNATESGMREILLPLALEKGTITVQRISGELYFITPSAYGNTAYYLKASPGGPNVLQASISFLPFMIATLILSLLSVLILSKKLYKPIGELVDTLVDEKDEEISCNVKNEIEYLAKQVSRIRYENQDLSQIVRDSFADEKRRFLASLFHGTYNPEILQNDLDRYDLNWLNSVNFIVRMEVGGAEDDTAEAVFQNVIDLVLRQIATSFIVESVYISGQNYFVIHSEDLGEAKTALSRAASTIETVFGFAVTFYIGKPSKSVAALNFSLMTIEKVYEASSPVNIKCVYDFGDVRNSQKAPAIYPIAIEQKLLANIENGNQVGTDQIIDYIFKEYGQAFAETVTRNMLTSALANTINRCAQRLSLNLVEIFGQDVEDVYQMLSACQNVSLLKEHTYTLIHGILEAGGMNRTKLEHTKKEEIERYVKENLRKEISLITMADYFQLTPNYMSSIFKEVLGENFKDYTSRMRFEAGIEYLRQTPDITMVELAEKIGLNNTTTLLRLFKKYAHCTPSIYVEKYLKQK